MTTYKILPKHNQVPIMGQSKCYILNNNAEEAGKCGAEIVILS